MDSNPFRAEHERMQQEARKSSGVKLLTSAANLARDIGAFDDRTDAFLGSLGIIAVKVMKSSPNELNDLLRELGRLAK